MAQPTPEQLARRRAVGDRVRRLRKRRKLTQEELGYLAGMHPKYVGIIERAERSVGVDKLLALVEALNCHGCDIIWNPRVSMSFEEAELHRHDREP